MILLLFVFFASSWLNNYNYISRDTTEILAVRRWRSAAAAVYSLSSAVAAPFVSQLLDLYLRRSSLVQCWPLECNDNSAIWHRACNTAQMQLIVSYNMPLYSVATLTIQCMISFRKLQDMGVRMETDFYNLKLYIPNSRLILTITP